MLFMLSSTFLIHQSSQNDTFIDEAAKTFENLCLSNSDCDNNFIEHFCCNQDLINQCCNGFQYFMVNQSLDIGRFNIVFSYALIVFAHIIVMMICLLVVVKLTGCICDCCCSKINRIKASRIYTNIDRSPIL